MVKLALVFGFVAAAVGASASQADGHGGAQCSRWRHGHCADSNGSISRDDGRTGYAVGHLFGPRYSYVAIGSVPPPIVQRYHLRPSFRYVNEDGFIYVVDPRTYRVVRVIPAPM
jgi:hypothetical protein